MKQLKQFLIILAVGFVCGLLLGQAAKALFTGESFRVPVPKRVTVIVPFSVPPLP